MKIFQETHFPYNPAMPSTGSLLCDQPENRQREETRSDAAHPGESGTGKSFDIRALSPSDITILPLTTPEPDSMSTMTLLADDSSMSTLTMLADNDDRSLSACSEATLEGDDLDTDSDTESLL